MAAFVNGDGRHPTDSVEKLPFKERRKISGHYERRCFAHAGGLPDALEIAVVSLLSKPRAILDAFLMLFLFG
jgi:hypothetical protein